VTHISVCQSLQEVGFAAAVLADQAITAADSEFDRAVTDELISLDRHRESSNFDIPENKRKYVQMCG